jgi:hypothetical protein
MAGAAAASKPASPNASTRRDSRALAPPPGSPRKMPLPMLWTAHPGVSVATLACTTQPTTWRWGIAAVIRPSGSTTARVAASAAPRPSANHQGIPFIAGTTTVSSSSKPATARATEASAGAFTAITTRHVDGREDFERRVRT